MRAWLMSLMVIAVAFGSLATSVTPAGAIGRVDAWITVSSTAPAVGCAVDLAVELRKDGSPAPNSDVLVALSYGGELVSADQAATDESGIANLAVDASAGVGDWIDIMVGGTFLTGFYVAAGEGASCEDGGKLIEAHGRVPVGSIDSSDANFPSYITYQQQRGLSCEYASLFIATSAWHNPISEYEFDDVVGWSENPHKGYRGNIEGQWGNTTDYGVYAAPLAKALAQFGFVGEAFYGEGDKTALTSRIDDNKPVVVWISIWGDKSEVYWDADGDRYTVVAGEHVVVAYDYDDYGVFISDPGSGTLKHVAWADFMWMWDVLDGMGLAVYPAE